MLPIMNSQCPSIINNWYRGSVYRDFYRMCAYGLDPHAREGTGLVLFYRRGSQDDVHTQLVQRPQEIIELGHLQ